MKKTAAMNKNRRNNYLFIFLCLLYPMGVWLFFFVTVNSTSIIMSFQNIDFYGKTSWAGLSNFKEFIRQSFSNGGIVYISVINSILRWIICLVISLPLYLIFAYYIFKKTPGAKWVRNISMVTRLIPGMVMSLLFKNFISNALPAVMLDVFGKEIGNLFSESGNPFAISLFYDIWLSFATSLIVYPNAMNAIGDEVFESAQLDGVDNIFTEMWCIILPLIFPTISTFLITGFAGIFTESGSLVTFWMNDAPAATYNMGYYYYVQVMKNTNNQMGYPLLSAGGLLMTLIIAPLTNLLKYLLEKYGPGED